MTDDELDRLAGALLTPAAPTQAERDAAWRDIAHRLERRPRPRPRSCGPRPTA